MTDEEAIEANRELLFAVAYRMLGTVADAEDAVQDAWLRWSAAPRAGRHPAAGVPGQDGLGAGRTLSR